MFGSSEMIIVLVIVLVLFGGSQLPKLAKNLGKAQKEFKDGIAEADKADEKPASESASAKTETKTESNDAPPSS